MSVEMRDERDEIGRRVAFDVIDLSALAADDDAVADIRAARDAGNDEVEFARREVDRGDAVRGDDDHLVALRGERILMEVKALAVRIAREANHPMAGVGVDPFSRRLLGRAGGKEVSSQSGQ